MIDPKFDSFVTNLNIYFYHNNCVRMFNKIKHIFTVNTMLTLLRGWSNYFLFKWILQYTLCLKKINHNYFRYNYEDAFHFLGHRTHTHYFCSSPLCNDWAMDWFMRIVFIVILTHSFDKVQFKYQSAQNENDTLNTIRLVRLLTQTTIMP